MVRTRTVRNPRSHGNHALVSVFLQRGVLQPSGHSGFQGEQKTPRIAIPCNFAYSLPSTIFPLDIKALRLRTASSSNLLVNKALKNFDSRHIVIIVHCTITVPRPIGQGTEMKPYE